MTRDHISLNFNFTFPVLLPPTWQPSLYAPPMTIPWASTEETAWLSEKIPQWRQRTKGEVEDLLTTTTNAFVVAFPARASMDHEDLCDVSVSSRQEVPSFTNRLCAENQVVALPTCEGNGPASQAPGYRGSSKAAHVLWPRRR